MRLSPSPEFDVLRLACRRSFAPGERDERALSALLEPADWRSVLRLARRHRVQALAWNGLRDHRQHLPDDLAAELQQEASAIAAHNLSVAAELGRLKEHWSAAGLPVLCLKGLTLGALAYREPMLKMSWDIDILVPPERVEEAGRMLLSAGYGPALPEGLTTRIPLAGWHKGWKESVWVHRGKQIWLDLHTRLADRPDLIPEITVSSASQQVEVAPGLSLPTLATDELFAYLCVHGTSSAWFRLKWITDLAAFLHGRAPAEIARLYEESQRLGAGRSAAQALLLADLVYGSLDGSDLRGRMSKDRVNRWLARMALRLLLDEDEPTDSIMGRAMIHVSQLPLVPGLRAPVGEMFRQGRHILLRGR